MLLVSPHLDDAALSCSARILSGQINEVVTIFAGVPPTNTPLSEWDRLTRATSAASRVRERRAEDEAAWASIAQPFQQLNHVETQHAAPNPRAISADIARAAKGYRTVLLPAGIGGHADHCIVRNIGLSVIKNADILLYGELPYAAFYGWPPGNHHLDVEAYWRDAFRAVASNSKISSPRLVRLAPHQKRAKFTLLGHYRSQFSAVTGGSLNLAMESPLFDYEIDFRFTR